MGSMQAFPTSRRSDRAYSTDYDSNRSNRGSNRGGRISNRGRNSMSSGNPRYSSRRGNDRGNVGGGDDTEEEFHHRGGSYSNSNKFQGGRGSGRGGGGNFSQNKQGGKGDFRRGTGNMKDDQQQQHRDGSSIDRGMSSLFSHELLITHCNFFFKTYRKSIVQ